MKNWIQKNKDIIITMIYAVITFLLISCHELWRDEAQQWLIVKELSFIDVIKQMKYEGHFLLWYIILFPLAKLNLGVYSPNIVAWLIMVITVFLVLKKAPFHYFTKILLVFSSPFLYYYSVHARVYCLIPLAEVFVAMAYKNKNEKPYIYMLTLAFLANTHVIMWGQVGVLLLEFFIEFIVNYKSKTKEYNRRIILSFILIIVLLLISVLPLFGSLNTNGDIKNDYRINFYNLMMFFLVEPFLQIINCFYCGVYLNITLYFILFLVLVLTIYIFKNYLKIGLEILGCLLWQYGIYAFVFETNIHKSISIILIIMFFTWIMKYKYRIKKNKFDKGAIFILIILMISNIFSVIYISFLEYYYNYSSAKEVAEYIEENIEEDSIIINGDLPEICTSIMVYSDKVKFYNVQIEDYFSYIVWNNDIRKELKANFLDDVIYKYKEVDKLYYIYPKYKVFKKNDKKIIMQLEKEGRIKKIFVSNDAIDEEETYILYKIEK